MYEATRRDSQPATNYPRQRALEFLMLPSSPDQHGTISIPSYERSAMEATVLATTIWSRKHVTADVPL